MSKFKINDKIMGISEDMSKSHIVFGKIIRIIKADPVLYQSLSYIVETDTGTRDIIYEAEAIEYDGFKTMQANIFYEEADRLENKVKELRESAKITIYSGNSK